MATTFRTDVVTGLYTALVAFQAANPTNIYSVHKVQPGDMAGTPLIYIGDRDERIEYSVGIRRRQMALTVILVGSYADRDTNAVRTDATVDLLVDYFQSVERTIVPAAGGKAGAIFNLERVDDRDVRVGDAIYPITVFTFREPGDLMEGRG